MFRGHSFKQKEVINVTTAERLGYIRDVEINERTGNIEAIIVPRRASFFLRLLGGGEIIIPWSSIETVGSEIVLVRIFDTETQKLT